MEASEVFANVMPFTGEMMPQAPSEPPAVLAEAVAQREIAEVQAAMTIAKRFPRNQAKATDRIMVACQRPSLAEGALYTYARGGADITGPSIRLAEAIAQQWGNLSFGIRELDQRLGESTVEAYAWDLETNTRQTKTFQVKHYRHTKKGGYGLTDPRDIYEMVANQGARRLRACILGVIPGDVVEAAVNQCEATLKAKADISPDAVKKMVEVFAPYGVTQEMIEARIQRKLDSITPAQIISLRKVYNSLKDGMSKPGDWFDAPLEEKPAPTAAPAQEKKTRAPRTTPPAAGPPQLISQVTLDKLYAVAKEKGFTEEKLLKMLEGVPLVELTEDAGLQALAALEALAGAAPEPLVSPPLAPPEGGDGGSAFNW